MIDTVGVKIGPFAMVDMYGTPYGPALHIVERYRLLDYEAAKEGESAARKGTSACRDPPGFPPGPGYKGKGLQPQFMVEDEGVFTMPKSAGIIYQRPLSPLGEWPESVCADNPHEYYAGKDSAVPTANKSDF